MPRKKVINVTFNSIKQDSVIECPEEKCGKKCTSRQVVSFKNRTYLFCNDSVPCHNAKYYQVIFMKIGEK